METGDQVAVAAGALGGVAIGVLASALGASGGTGVVLGGSAAFGTSVAVSSLLRNRTQPWVPVWLRWPASTGASLPR